MTDQFFREIEREMKYNPTIIPDRFRLFRISDFRLSEVESVLITFD